MVNRARWRLQQAARWFKYRFNSRALILMYHRVTDLPNDPHLLAVSPKRFADQMEVLREYYSPIRLGQLVEALQDGSVPDRAVVVTFDDGYADNLYQAKPLLERYEIPATVFVTAGQVGGRREFWWDALDRILLQPGTLPDRLRLRFDGCDQEWELGEAITYTQEDYERDRAWHIERRENPSSRHQLFRILCDRLLGLPVQEQRKILDELLKWAGSGVNVRPSHRTLTSQELVQLNQGGLVEIGAHTVTHPSLALLSPAEQRAEIEQSKECLQAIFEHPVTSFALPHGSSTSETENILREAGYDSACSSRYEAVLRNANCFHLPRVVVRDWPREPFVRWLRWWVGH